MPRVIDKEARRAELVSAAAAVFSERGVANTTVSDIVKEAGVAQGTFYLYFDCKDDVIPAVAAQLVDRMIDSGEDMLNIPGATAIDRLRALGDLLGDLEQTPGIEELVELIHLPQNRALHDRLAEHIKPRLVPLVESIIVQGVAEGAFDVADTHAAAWFVIGGLQSTELAGTPIDKMPGALAAATELALRALGYTESHS